MDLENTMIKYCAMCYSTNIKPIIFGYYGFLEGQVDCIDCNTRNISLEGTILDVAKMRKQYLKEHLVSKI